MAERALAGAGRPASAAARTGRWRGGLGRVLKHLPLVLVSLWISVPLLWDLGTSLKGRQEYYATVNTLLPRRPTLVNYEFMLTQIGNLPVYFFNSVLFSVGTVALTVVVSSLAAYAFARMEFRGRDLIFYALLMSMFIPRSGGLMALYELMSFLKLRNSILGLILLFAAAVPVPIFIMRQAFLNLPRELEESARVDGAGWFRVFWKIALPLTTSAVVVVAILTFVVTWGDFLVTFTMIDKDSQSTLAIGVRKVMVGAGGYQAFLSDQFAGLFATQAADAAMLLTAALPVVLIYLFLQRWFMRGVTEGALKF
jgi:ABC-type glycerol-3-phosphate transport system permease component